MNWSFNSALEDEPENQENQEPDDDDALYDGPYSSQSRKGKAPELPQPAEPARRTSPRRTQVPSSSMPPPQTPRRAFPLEIPSSQSPSTPISIHSKGSARRLPLKEMSINTPIPFNTGRRGHKSPEKVPILEVRDTFDTGTVPSDQNPLPSSPMRRSSVAKSVRFAIPEDDEETHVASPTPKRAFSQFSLSQTSPKQASRTEILDSDAESDDEIDLELEEPIQPVLQEHEEQDVAGEEPQPVQQEHEEQNTANEEPEPLATSNRDDEDLRPETCYGDIGLETQFEAGKLVDLASSSDADEESQVQSGEATFQEETQITASQRLSNTQVHAMAPRTSNSDVFISISFQKMEKILEKKIDYEKRNWPIPPTVSRIWMYELSPVSTLKYMAVIGPAKRPGQISNDSGEGNAEFNSKPNSKLYAYEILELYELANPLHISELKSNEWLLMPPPKTKWVTPAVIDQLMANLKPPLIGPNAIQDTPPSSATDTQEAEEQLMSTIRQFTQVSSPSQLHASDNDMSESLDDLEAIPSSPIPKLEPQDTQNAVLSSQIIKYEEQDADEIIPSSQQETDQQEDTPEMARLPRPSQATTVDLSQSQTPRQNSIIFESPRRRAPSSTPLRLPTLHPGSSDHQGPESLVPYSMASSQLLTRSQMLPESLLADSLPGPPMFVGDSDDDDDDAYSIEL
ncbi:hypothetical protein LSUE1_G003474 [Lachnellula suecica]|uniref:Uncharacterized protein n=1 Tax=Lachnellula suecica TaxID=602035 RepID=A0A8T9CGE3_9HELO|nr:hypothetical protein LSUE1_G003474 [Lachnellula suecica]